MAVKHAAGAARDRVLTAAVTLFSRHGVSGTSLQMIADEIGVTKAAVYHQFQSKDDIVQAVVAPYVQRLALLVDSAEAQRGRTRRAEAVLEGLVGLVVENRRLTAVLQSDPAVIHCLRETEGMRELESRITALLAGAKPDTEAVVGTVMLSGGLMIAATDQRLAELDDESLRHHLLINARRLLRMRTPATGTGPR